MVRRHDPEDEDDLLRMQEEFLRSKQTPSVTVKRRAGPSRTAVVPAPPSADAASAGSAQEPSVPQEQPSSAPAGFSIPGLGKITEKASAGPMPMRIPTSTGPRTLNKRPASRFAKATAAGASLQPSAAAAAAAAEPIGDTVLEHEWQNQQQAGSEPMTQRLQQGEGANTVAAAAQTPGFPAVFHRSHSAALAAGLRSSSVQAQQLGSAQPLQGSPATAEAQSMHEENLRKVQAMSPEEVQEAQQELAAMFSPAALEALRLRGLRKLTGTQGTAAAAAAGTPAAELSKQQSNSKAKPKTAVAATAVKARESAGTQPAELPPAPKQTAPESEAVVRVDERGAAVTPLPAEEAPRHDNPHHRTPEELVQLARSDVAVQRRAALRALTGLLRNRRAAISAGAAPAHHRLPERLPAALRLCVDSENSRENVAALEALEAYLVAPDELELWVSAPSSSAVGHQALPPLLRPQCTQEEQQGMQWLAGAAAGSASGSSGAAAGGDDAEDSDEPEQELSLLQASRSCYLDPVKGLLALQLLPRLSELLRRWAAAAAGADDDSSTPAAAAGASATDVVIQREGAVQCLKLLIAVARRGASQAARIVSEPGLLDAVREAFLEPQADGSLPVPLSDSSSSSSGQSVQQQLDTSAALWAIRLLRALCESSRVVALHLALGSKNSLLESSRAFLALGASSSSGSSSSSSSSQVLQRAQAEALYTWRVCLCYGIEVDAADTVLPLAQALVTASSSSSGKRAAATVAATGQWGGPVATRSPVTAALYSCLTQLALACIPAPRLQQATNSAAAAETALQEAALRPSAEAMAVLGDRIDAIAAATARQLLALAAAGELGTQHCAFAPMLHLTAVCVATHERRARTGRVTQSAEVQQCASQLAAAAVGSSVLPAAVDTVLRGLTTTAATTTAAAGDKTSAAAAASACDWLSGLFRLLLACSDCGGTTADRPALALAANAAALAALVRLFKHASSAAASTATAAGAAATPLARAAALALCSACKVMHTCVLSRGLWPAAAAPEGLAVALACPLQAVSLLQRGDELPATELVCLGLRTAMQQAAGSDSDSSSSNADALQFLERLYCSALCGQAALAHSRALHRGDEWYCLTTLSLRRRHSSSDASSAQWASLLPLPQHWLLLPLISQGEGALAVRIVAHCLQLLLQLEQQGSLYLSQQHISAETKLYHLMSVCLFPGAVLADPAVTPPFDALLQLWTAQCGQCFEQQLALTIERLNARRAAPQLADAAKSAQSISISSSTAAIAAAAAAAPAAATSTTAALYPGLMAFVTDLVEAFSGDSCGHRSAARVLRLVLRQRMPAAARALVWRELGGLGLLSLVLTADEAAADVNGEASALLTATATSNSSDSVAVYDSDAGLLDVYVSALKHSRFSSAEAGGPLFCEACAQLAHYCFSTSSTSSSTTTAVELQQWKPSWGKRLRFEKLLASCSCADAVLCWGGCDAERCRLLQAYASSDSMAEQSRETVRSMVQQQTQK
jgi:RPAP1-like, N-terminal